MHRGVYISPGSAAFFQVSRSLDVLIVKDLLLKRYGSTLSDEPFNEDTIALVKTAAERHNRETYLYPAYLQDRDKMLKENYMNFEEWIEYQDRAIIEAEAERDRKQRMRTRSAEDILAEAAEIEAKIAAQKEVN